MKKVTSGESRGSIALLCLMTAIAAFLIFNKGQQKTLPEPTADTIVLQNEISKDSTRSTKRRTTKKKGRKAPKKSNSPEGHSRDYLDEKT